MMTLQDQIQAQQKNKSEKLKDMFYVDYCYHCKEPDIRTSEKITCHHQWYCHHDGADAQDMEYRINRIQQDIWLRGYMCSHEHETLQKLNKEKWELIKSQRRKLPPIKHIKR